MPGSPQEGSGDGGLHRGRGQGELGTRTPGSWAGGWHLSLLHTGAAIQAQVDVAVVVEKLLQHVQHARHLREDEHTVCLRLQLPQQQVQRLKLPCRGAGPASEGVASQASGPATAWLHPSPPGPSLHLPA